MTTGQLWKVYELMSDGQFRTLDQIKTGLEGVYQGESFPTQSIGSRLRDLRTAKYGGSRVEKRKSFIGLWEYKISTSKDARRVLYHTVGPGTCDYSCASRGCDCT